MTSTQLHLLQDAAACLRRMRTKAADEAAERIEYILACDQEREEVEKPF